MYKNEKTSWHLTRDEKTTDTGRVESERIWLQRKFGLFARVYNVQRPRATKMKSTYVLSQWLLHRKTCPGRQTPM